MKQKILFLGFLMTFLVGCNDGDLEVENISFDNSDVLSCKNNEVDVPFLFKYNGKQALILTLPQGTLTNTQQSVSGSIPSNYKLYYRIFSDAVSTNYFCGSIPAATPQVVAQYEATGGVVSVTTNPIYDENTNQLLRYDHIIVINNLVIVNSEGNKLIDSSFLFGTYQTKD